MWQLEPHASRLSPRERTTSSTSTESTQSSFAFVSDPDISSSFAVSIENGLASDADDPPISSPALSSPISSSMDEQSGFAMLSHRRQPRFPASHPVSPPNNPPPFSLTSSYSSVESLHPRSGRLLTIYIEKAESVIWPSLVVGPVPESLSSSMLSAYPWASSSTPTVESKYNMDPTSLVLFALDLHDIREAYEEAFEYFIRAWHQAHVPSATIRLATHYLPVQSPFTQVAPILSTSPPMNTPSSALDAAAFTEIPITLNISSPIPTASTSASAAPDPSTLTPGTPPYYLDRVGGGSGLAQLFLAAGLLHLEGAATSLLSSAYTGLSSLRTPTFGSVGYTTSSSASGAETWRRDREAARRYFERARALLPTLDVPLLPADADSDSGSGAEGGDRRSPGSANGGGGERQQLKMPSIEIRRTPEPDKSKSQSRRRRKKQSSELSSSFMERCSTGPDAEGDDRTWYLYIPGLVGAGTALLVVGILSFSSWRKGQGS
ncbi:hypothetical protein AcV7_006554 [Taiwanofungus camphoratus]|nr:hypothetical protein AcV7_006554 [Antrodia cinnamomea]